MMQLITAYRLRPLKLAAHSWVMLAAAAAATFLLLPYAHSLYNGAHPLAGFALHRMLPVLFLVAAVMAGMSFAAQLHAGLARRGGSMAARLGNIAKAFLIAAPALILAGVIALLMLNGHRVGMALG